MSPYEIPARPDLEAEIERLRAELIVSRGVAQTFRVAHEQDKVEIGQLRAELAEVKAEIERMIETAAPRVARMLTALEEQQGRLSAVLALCDEEIALIGPMAARWYQLDKIRSAATGADS